MKRYKIWPLVLAVLFAVAVFLAPKAFANDACKIAGESDPLICGTPDSDEEVALIATAKGILNTVYLWIGVLAVIFIVVGGINYMTSTGEAEKIKRAKATITYSICGLVVTLGAFAITNFVIGALEGRAPSEAVADTESGGREEGGGSFGEDRYKVRSVTAISKTTVMVGDSFTIKTRVLPDYAKNKTLAFTSSNPAIATVDQNGIVKTKKVGQVTITIKSADGPSAEAKITITKQIPVTSIQLDKSEVRLKKNKTATVKATPLPNNANDKTLIWSSKDSKVATVNQSGKIKAITPGKETTVVVTARNKVIVASNQNPNKITLADVEVANELPEVKAVIKVVVESDTYNCIAYTNKKHSGNFDVRPATRAIIKKHLTDFNSRTIKEELKRRGGYTTYLKDLGGIFAINAGGKNKYKVTSACDIQAAAEHVWGLWTIWGIDYDNGKSYHTWGKGSSDGFYKGSGKQYAGAGYFTSKKGNFDDMMNSTTHFRTNCNIAISMFFTKLKTQKISTKTIHNTSELQVGDIVLFYNESGNFNHMTMVGEVYKDYIIMYDGGSRFMNSKLYKKKTKRGGATMTGDYGGYGTRWKALRKYKIDQSKVLEGL